MEKDPEPAWATLEHMKPMLLFYRKEYIMTQLRGMLNLHDEDGPFVEMVLRRHPFWPDDDIVKEVKRIRLHIANFKMPDPTNEVLKQEGYLRDSDALIDGLERVKHEQQRRPS